MKTNFLIYEKQIINDSLFISKSHSFSVKPSVFIPIHLWTETEFTFKAETK